MKLGRLWWLWNGQRRRFVAINCLRCVRIMCNQEMSCVDGQKPHVNIRLNTVWHNTLTKIVIESVCVCDWKRENFEIAHLDHFFSSTLNIHHSGFHRQSVTFFLNAITHNLLKHMFNGDYSAPEKLSCHRNLNNMSTQRLMECMDTSYIYNELTNYRIHTHTQ